MSSHGVGQFERTTMNAVVDVETARRFACAIEDSEAARLGIRLGVARRRLASRMGISPGTLENLRKLRTKIVPHWLMERMRAEFISVLQNEMRRLEHEIQIARQTGLSHRDDDLAKAEAQLVAAKKILGV